ncbi:MAG: shikimate dehydrogenase [Dehalococcoidia bacterium]|nr:shikimate dehydrogenase [Dehalococcoidia bacterium]
MINARTKLCGIIGNPVRHTVSPAMHNAAIAHLKINYAYMAFEVSGASIETALSGVRALGITGLNVTIPHKVSVLPLLDELDPLAQNIGAVNTIVNQNGKLKGYNTDASGFAEALRIIGFNAKDKLVVLLGAGGTARAIGFALAQQGAYISLLCRSSGLEQAKLLAQNLDHIAQHTITTLELNDANLRKELSHAKLLVNATSAGMAPNDTETPCPAELLEPGMAVFDVVYTPLNTRLLKEAHAKSCLTVSGLDMLIHQGAQAFKLWTGQDAPIDVMRRAAIAELKLCSAKETTVKPAAPKTAVALIGFMGAGKSSVGRALARKMGKAFVDIDRRVEKSAGKSISRIFSENGESAFRAIEKEITRTVSSSGKKVIACGGGVVLDAENITHLKRYAVVIYIKSDPSIIMKRLAISRSRRPLLAQENWVSHINTLMSAREPLYAKAADITIENGDADIDSAIALIMQKLGRYESFNF